MRGAEGRVSLRMWRFSDSTRNTLKPISEYVWTVHAYSCMGRSSGSMEHSLIIHRRSQLSRPHRTCITRAGVPNGSTYGKVSVPGVDDSDDVLAGIVASRPKVTFRSELWSTSDRTVLQRSMHSWRSRASQLCPFYKEEITDVSQLQPDSFELKWRATWVPNQLLWLDSLGKAWPGVSVEYYDILDRCEPRRR